jgi:uncharacterized protein YndB with AHSA1/START domain
MNTDTYVPGIRPQSVLEKTGKPLEYWFEVLERFGCRSRGHRESALHLYNEHGVSAWWSQTLTVEYERVNGIRVVGQQSRGFGTNHRRTLTAPLHRVWQCLTDPGHISGWFGEIHSGEISPGSEVRFRDATLWTVRIVEPEVRIRLFWTEDTGRSVVQFSLHPRSDGRTVIEVSHEQIPTHESQKALKARWAAALSTLEDRLRHA